MTTIFVELQYFRGLYVLTLGWLSEMGLSNIIMKMYILLPTSFPNSRRNYLGANYVQHLHPPQPFAFELLGLKKSSSFH